MKNRKSREPSPLFIVTLILLVFCVVITLNSYANVATNNNQIKRETPEEVRKNEYLISQITYCRVLALNINMPEQVKRYAIKLEKFDNFYYEYKIFYAGQAVGFFNGILAQMGFSNPSKNQIKNVAQQLYFRQCDIPL